MPDVIKIKEREYKILFTPIEVSKIVVIAESYGITKEAAVGAIWLRGIGDYIDILREPDEPTDDVSGIDNSAIVESPDQ